VSYLLILPRGYRANKVLVTRERLRGMNHVHHQLMHVRIMLMHLIHAYIESIVILASWCMHHWASIVAIALCHMHHFARAWNTPSLCCTIIAIIHLNSAVMVIYRALHSELEHFVIIPWLHRYKWACFVTSIMQIIQVINSEQGGSKHHS